MNQPAQSLTRERISTARIAVFAAFAVNGFAIASWMSRVPDVKETLGLTPGKLGFLLLAISAGSLLGLPTAGKMAEKFGAANTIRGGACLMLPGIIIAASGVTLAHSVPITMIGLMMVGVGTGIWDVCQNLEGASVEQAQKRSIMPWFHAAFSGGTVLGALLGAGLVWLNVSILVHLSAVALIGAITVIWAAMRFLPRIPVVPPTQSSGGAVPAVRARSAWTEPRTLAIGVMVLAAAFTEGTANDWMAVAFVDGHDVSNALGVVALAIFLSFMTAGRIIGTSLLDRYGRVPVLVTMFIAAIGGSLLVIFGNTIIAFIGAAIWGLGASLGFPVGMSAAADEPSRAAARISVVSTIGYLAFLAGPPLLGFLGDHVGVLNAMLTVTAVSVFAMFVIRSAQPPKTEEVEVV